MALYSYCKYTPSKRHFNNTSDRKVRHAKNLNLNPQALVKTLSTIESCSIPMFNRPTMSLKLVRMHSSNFQSKVPASSIFLNKDTESAMLRAKRRHFSRENIRKSLPNLIY